MKNTFYSIVFEINFKAIPEKKEMNPPVNFSASSLHNFSRLLNGESSTMQAIYGFLSTYISEVTAPMLLPHNPIELTVFKLRKY